MCYVNTKGRQFLSVIWYVVRLVCLSWISGSFDSAQCVGNSTLIRWLIPYIVQNSRWTHVLHEKFISDFFSSLSLSLSSCSLSLHKYYFTYSFIVYKHFVMVCIEKIHIIILLIKKVEVLLLLLLLLFFSIFSFLLLLLLLFLCDPLHLIWCISFFWSASYNFDRVIYNGLVWNGEKNGIERQRKMGKNGKETERKVNKINRQFFNFSSSPIRQTQYNMPYEHRK